MDLLDFEAETMYFEEPLDDTVSRLLTEAADAYGSSDAEARLLRAHELAPNHASVLVALYRYYFYQHRYEEALDIGQRALERAAREVGLSPAWETWSMDDVMRAGKHSMTWTRFALFALKGAGYLQMRLDNIDEAIRRLSKILEIDSDDRLHVSTLIDIAHRRRREQTLRIV